MEHINNTATVIPMADLLVHWQGHRSLTRRLIEAFPEKELFTFSIGGMRPFAQLAREMMGIAGLGIHGIVTNNWQSDSELEYYRKEGGPQTKDELLRIWDKVTRQIDELWPKLTPQRFREPIKAFGLYEGTVSSSLLYFIDNEIHHLGQGFVYLRAPGIEPPPFWDR